MGIKDTGDYLTIRFANPTTGLVTPSICGDSSPRTPMTPGEAIVLFNNGPIPKQLSNTVAATHMRMGLSYRPQYRKKDDQGRWIGATVTASPPRVTQASFFETRVASHQSVDHALLQPPALNSDALPLHKKPSVGAGPRKFAAASQALKAHEPDRRPELRRRTTAVKRQSTDQETNSITSSQPHVDQGGHRTSQTTADVLVSQQLTQAQSNSGAEQTKLIVQEVTRTIRKPLPFMKGQPVSTSAKDDSHPVGVASTASHKELNNNSRVGPMYDNVKVEKHDRRDTRNEVHAQTRVATRGDKNGNGIVPAGISDSRRPPIEIHTDQCCALLLSALKYCASIAKPYMQTKRLSSIWPALEKLLAPGIPSNERWKALGTILPALGQIAILLTIASLVWRIVTAIMELIEIALWPLVIVRECLHLVFHQ